MLAARGRPGAGARAARTAPTASGWRSWPAKPASPPTSIDGAADIDDRWFDGDETVLITAGASAPESVVEECVDYPQEPLRRHGRIAAASARRTSTSRCRASCAY